MSEWKKVRLGEIANYVNEKIDIKAFDTSLYINTDSMLKDKGGIGTPESIPESGKVTKYQHNDILVSNIRPYFKKIWFSNREGGCSNDVLVFRANDNIDSTFLYYVLSDDSFFDHMMSSANGTKMPRGNRKLIPYFEIPLPPLATQHRVATILSRYDSLIENYQKQIKLLEEAAQRLYKEWFVDLRFPGHENTKIIDGVPEGWEKKKLCELFSFVRGKSYTSKELSDEGTIMVNLKNIQSFGGYKSDVEKHFIGTFKEEQTLMKGDLIMGVTDMTQERRLVGSVALIPDFKETATFSMDLIKLISFKLPNIYLYCAMRYGDVSRQIAPLANGVNVLHLKPEAISNIEMVVASDSIIEKFVNYTSKTIESILTLQSQLRLITEARDRLLPKLMSGEIEI